MLRHIEAGAVTAAFVLVFAAAEASASHAFTETVSRTIAIGSEKTVIIDGINGDISVTGEEGRNEISVKMIKSGNVENEAEAEEIIRQMDIRITRSDGKIRIETIYPKNYQVKKNLISFLVKRQAGISMGLEVILPKNIEAAVSTASGRISIIGMGSDVRADASSGDVEMRNIGGSAASAVSAGSIGAANIGGHADLKTESGRIYAKNVSGNVTAGTSSGRIELSEIGGNLKCTIEYGTVIVEGVGDIEYRGISAEARFIDVRGAIDASTASGATSFRVKPAKDADYKIIASSGDISLRFLHLTEGGYVLRAGTTTGEISIDLPIDIKNVGRNSISGVVRDGKGKVFVETASGNISIEESEE